MIEIPLKGGYEHSKQSFITNLDDNQVMFDLEFLSYVENPHWIISVYRDSFPIVVSRALLVNTEITTFSKMNIVLIKTSEFMQLEKLTDKDKPKEDDLKDGDKAKPSIIDKVKSGVVSTVENVTKSVTDAANKVLDVIPSTAKDIAGKVKDFIL